MRQTTCWRRIFCVVVEEIEAAMPDETLLSEMEAFERYAV